MSRIAAACLESALDSVPGQTVIKTLRDCHVMFVADR